MDQNTNSEATIKTVQKRVHKIGKIEYELTPGLANDKTKVSYDDAGQILKLGIDQIRKLAAELGWPKEYDMNGRVLNTYIPRQSVMDHLHQKSFHEVVEAGPGGDKEPAGEHQHKNPATGQGAHKSGLALLGQEEIKELIVFKGLITDIVAKKDEKISTLEIKNESIIKELLKEKDEKSDLKLKASNLKHYLFLGGVILAIGGGVATFFLYSLNKDNDRLYDEKKQDRAMIVNLNSDDSNWRTKSKTQDDEINQLKSMIPTLQNQEINTVKKD